MEKYLEMLPEDIVNKMYLYMSHPIVDIIEEDRSNMLAWEGFGQTWDEFVRIQLERYRKKHRKKPKHGLIVGEEIYHYRRLSRGQDRVINPKEIKLHQWILPRNRAAMHDDDYGF